MAFTGTDKFEKRLSRIEAQRRAMKKGVIYSVNHDGLIIARPRRKGLRRPVHLIFVALAAVMVFKAAMYAHLGESTYTSRVDELASGTMVERVGAWAMQADAATVWLGQQIKMALF